MGRRNRAKAEDEYDDLLEREYMKKRRRTNEGEKKREVRSETVECQGDQKGRDESPEDAEKIEKMRLKQQQRKERRKEKKAAAAEALGEREREQKEAKAAAEALTRRRMAEKKDREKAAKSSSPRKFILCSKGVKYADVVVGKGPAVQDRKKVRVKYTLRAKKHTTGKVLDSGSNFSFRLGRGEVIKGWDIGVAGMRQGGMRHLVVPKQAGYGNRDVGAGSGADLFFEITLLSC